MGTASSAEIVPRACLSPQPPASASTWTPLSAGTDPRQSCTIGAPGESCSKGRPLDIDGASGSPGSRSPAAETASADGGQIRIQSNLEYIYSDIQTENKQTGEKIDSTFSYFKQKYNIEFLKEIFPYLDFRGGGFLELIDSSNGRGRHHERDSQRRMTASGPSSI